MFALICVGAIGFVIGRIISLVIAQLLLQNHIYGLKAARTLIVLGSGGEQKK